MNEQINTRKLRETVAVESIINCMPHLSEFERAAVRSLPFVHRFSGRRSLIMEEGERMNKLLVVCSGWAMRQVTLADGRRQVLDFVLPGDVVGLHIDSNQIATCDVVALTSVEIAEIDFDQIARRTQSNPAIGMGLNIYFLREMTMLSDQVLRLGRMTAYERVCHMLLEIYFRQRDTGRVEYDGSVAFPITQTIAADALGLSVVHVNRQVMQLRREGLVSLTRNSLTVHDPATLQEICGYRPRALNAVPGYLGLHAAE
ncbi:MAG: Crp/Fnr family transcriptional regulator [Silicimonas sp.]|nr:Crp/Fnr family transcriptional regulator [Silicimonas sp.]